MCPSTGAAAAPIAGAPATFHELVLITEEIRQLINERKSAQEITRAAAKIGYRSLRYDGLRKVLLGLTTIEEIEQNTSSEWAT